MKRLSTDEFISVVQSRYGKRLSILGTYQGSGIKILVQCQNGHSFYSTPSNILDRRRSEPACRQCDGNNKRKTHDTFLQELNAVHLGLIVPMGVYIGANKPLDIKCSTCGHQWICKDPVSLLAGGGCRKCGYLNNSHLQPKGHKQFLKELSRAHEGSIEALGIYKTALTKIEVRCLACFHAWSPTPASLLFSRNGNHPSGCPVCANYGFHADLPAIVYYARVDNPYGYPLYKIGITNNTLRDRYNKELSKMTLLSAKYYEVGTQARQEEMRILNEHRGSLFSGPPVLKSGNTELFSRDILMLDKGHLQLGLW